LSIVVFLIAAYFYGVIELIQYIPITFMFVGLEGFIGPLQDLLNNGKEFEMSGATYILIIPLSFVVARLMAVIYKLIEGKIVKTKDDVVKKFRSSKEYRTTFD